MSGDPLEGDPNYKVPPMTRARLTSSQKRIIDHMARTEARGALVRIWTGSRTTRCDPGWIATNAITLYIIESNHKLIEPVINGPDRFYKLTDLGKELARQ